jgi:hypothetical protein
MRGLTVAVRAGGSFDRLGVVVRQDIVVVLKDKVLFLEFEDLVLRDAEVFLHQRICSLDVFQLGLRL